MSDDRVSRVQALVAAGDLNAALQQLSPLLEEAGSAALARRTQIQLLLQLGRYSDALAACSYYLQNNAQDLEVWRWSVSIMLSLHAPDDARRALQLIQGLGDDSAEYWHLQAVLAQREGDFPSALACIEKACQRLPSSASLAALRVSLLASVQPGSDAGCHHFRQWAQRFADPLAQAFDFPGSPRQPDRPLRVGYVSGDFREHAVFYLIAPVLADQDPLFEVHLFSNGPIDAVSEQIQQLGSVWHDIRQLSDDAACAYIRQQGIDILVDLSGHSDRNRLLVFARRAAPLQVTWFGEMRSTGLAAMDYRFTDTSVDPPGKNDAHYSEQLVYLKSMAVFYSDPRTAEIGPTPALQNGFLNLICLNGAHRISDASLVLWLPILLYAPESELTLVGFADETSPRVQDIRNFFRNNGVGTKRIHFRPRLPMIKFLQLGNEFDVVLDTIPVSGGTTPMHCLWMGLPVIVRAQPDKCAIENAAANTMGGAGFPELAHNTDEAYHANVLAFASTPARLNEFRQHVRQRMMASELMNYQPMLDSLKTAYRQIWQNYCGSGSI